MSGRHTEIDRSARARQVTRGLGHAQRQAVNALLQGRSVLLVVPDGWGHSACWQAAAVAHGGPVLVIAPPGGDLAARAENLAERPGLVAAHLDAARPPSVMQALREQLRAGHFNVIFVSVRQLGDPRVLQAATALRPWLVVVEAAGRLTPSADIFDPSWARVGELLAALDHPTTLALAEVAPPSACDRIADRLALSEALRITAGMARPDLRLEARSLTGHVRRDRHLLGLLDERPVRAVVFVGLRADAERLAALIEEECELPCEAVHGGTGPERFRDALRRFREGGARVLIATGSLGRGERWPEVPLVVHYALPHSLARLQREAMLAGGEGGGRSVLLFDREELAWRERAAWHCAPEPGHLLAIHRAAAASGGQRLTYRTLSRLTGLHRDEVHLGVEALTVMGALEVAARGDEWIEAQAQSLPAQGMSGYAVEADLLRRARLDELAQVVAYARTRRCRRAFLAEALGYEAADAKDCCDRCAPRPATPRPYVFPGGYPIAAGEFRGWALCLYRRPGADEPTDKAARLLHALKYDGEADAASGLSWLMARRVRQRSELTACEVVVPIPSSQPERPDSAAALLARLVALRVGRPLASALAQVAEHIPQKELASEEQKRRNIRGAFEVVDVGAIRDRIVLLVDDVFDSGATLREAAQALRRAGAADVRLLTAVRTSFGWRSDR
ncbi:MAG: helicase-related protein [Armatimonadota bacterium]